MLGRTRDDKGANPFFIQSMELSSAFFYFILFLYRYLYFTHSFSLFYFIYSFPMYTVRAYFTHSFSLFYSIFVYSFSLFSVPAWVGLYRVVD